MIKFRPTARRSRSCSREKYPRQRGQRAIEELVGRLIQRHGLTDAVREHCVITFWPEIVGAQAGAITRPDVISRGVLRVTTGTSTHLQELQFIRARVVQQINHWVAAQRWLAPAPAPLVTDVRFTIGTLRAPLAPEYRRQQVRHWERLRPDRAALLAADRAEIVAATCLVEDAELRALIERVRLDWNR